MYTGTGAAAAAGAAAGPATAGAPLGPTSTRAATEMTGPGRVTRASSEPPRQSESTRHLSAPPDTSSDGYPAAARRAAPRRAASVSYAHLRPRARTSRVEQDHRQRVRAAVRVQRGHLRARGACDARPRGPLQWRTSFFANTPSPGTSASGGAGGGATATATRGLHTAACAHTRRARACARVRDTHQQCRRGHLGPRRHHAARAPSAEQSPPARPAHTRA